MREGVQDHTSPYRFTARSATGGSWVIVDGGCKDRLVASCPAKDEAMAIAALLNGDPTRAWQLHQAYIALFDAMSRD
jgi:hypothetical protein